MRARLSRLGAPLLLLVLGGCPTLEIDQPIVLVPDADWTAGDREIVRRAAECWNLRFSTQLQLDSGQLDLPQRVQMSYNDFACIFGIGRTEPYLPVQISVCEQRLDDLFAPWMDRSASLFRVILHELGHVLNIRREGERLDPYRTGYGGVMSRSPSAEFTAEDEELFSDANPGFAWRSSCVEVEVENRDALCYCHK
jgi:hypothetical protein